MNRIELLRLSGVRNYVFETGGSDLENGLVWGMKGIQAAEYFVVVLEDRKQFVFFLCEFVDGFLFLGADRATTLSCR